MWSLCLGCKKTRSLFLVLWQFRLINAFHQNYKHYDWHIGWQHYEFRMAMVTLRVTKAEMNYIEVVSTAVVVAYQNY